MRQYSTMPLQLVEGLTPRPTPHPRGEQRPYHYHDAEEWLQVVEGEITFFSAGDLQRTLLAPGDPLPFTTDQVRYSLGPGEALHIPQGEVHRVEGGSRRATYNMWAPGDLGYHELEEEDRLLVWENLRLPGFENVWTTRGGDPLPDPVTDAGAFLRDFVSEELTFSTAGGVILGKSDYLRRTGGAPRTPSDGVRILYKKAPEGETPARMLVQTVVHTRDADTRASYANYRLFYNEGPSGSEPSPRDPRVRGWKCRVWMNCPESTVA
jgi:mannose-6-phosphate isomerase-like protein (cupin superfamily)